MFVMEPTISSEPSSMFANAQSFSRAEITGVTDINADAFNTFVPVPHVTTMAAMNHDTIMSNDVKQEVIFSNQMLFITIIIF